MKKNLAISSVLIGIIFLAGCGQQQVNQTLPIKPVAAVNTTVNQSGIWDISRNKNDDNTEYTTAQYGLDLNHNGKLDISAPDLEPTYKHVTITDEKTALANCQDEIKKGNDDYICTKDADLRDIKQFYAILTSPDDQSLILEKLFNTSSMGLLHVGAYNHNDVGVLRMKKVQNGYLSLIQSLQYVGADNFDFMYYGLKDGKSIVLHTQPSSDPLAKNARAWEIAKEKVDDMSFQNLQHDFMTGKFENVALQSYVDAFLQETKTIKDTIDNTPAQQLESSFTCGTSTVSDVEGNIYQTVLIGTQCWMKSNLMTTKKPDGTSIPKGCVEAKCAESNDFLVDRGQYSCPPNSTNDGEDCAKSTLQTYGLLYQWSAAMNGSTTEGVQGICPSGWHIPKDTEWRTLVESQSTLGCEIGDGRRCSPAAMKLSLSSNWFSMPLSKATNTSGFSLQPSGSRGENTESDRGTYSSRSSNAAVWSSTDLGQSKSALYRGFDSSVDSVERNNADKAQALSVRCLKD